MYQYYEGLLCYTVLHSDIMMGLLFTQVWSWTGLRERHARGHVSEVKQCWSGHLSETEAYGKADCSLLFFCPCSAPPRSAPPPDFPPPRTPNTSSRTQHSPWDHTKPSPICRSGLYIPDLLQDVKLLIINQTRYHHEYRNTQPSLWLAATCVTEIQSKNIPQL